MPPSVFFIAIVIFNFDADSLTKNIHRYFLALSPNAANSDNAGVIICDCNIGTISVANFQTIDIRRSAIRDFQRTIAVVCYDQVFKSSCT